MTIDQTKINAAISTRRTADEQADQQFLGAVTGGADPQVAGQQYMQARTTTGQTFLADVQAACTP